MSSTNLPQRIFCSGSPGSRWSAITQRLWALPNFNRTDINFHTRYDRWDTRKKKIAKYFHHGSYFEHNTPLPVTLDVAKLDATYADPSAGTMIHRSHQYAFILDAIKEMYPNDWIWLIYRPDFECYTQWIKCGGFYIDYPDYSFYQDEPTMMSEIAKQNNAKLAWVRKHNLKWEPLNEQWDLENFGFCYQSNNDKALENILCCLYKGNEQN